MVRETAFDEVFDSQAAFRALLVSLSRPGTISAIPPRPYGSLPDGLSAPALSILKTLCDHRVSFSVGSLSAKPEWVSYLEMNLSTPFRAVDEADYVLFDGEQFDADFLRLNPGSLEFPERSGTALLCVRLLSDQGEPARGDRELILTGPGVKGRARLSVGGLDARYIEERASANRFYPMGIDLLLVDADGRVAGIPRTSAVEAG